MVKARPALAGFEDGRRKSREWILFQSLEQEGCPVYTDLPVKTVRLVVSF